MPTEDLYLSDHAGAPGSAAPDTLALDELRRARAVVYAWGSCYTATPACCRRCRSPTSPRRSAAARCRRCCCSTRCANSEKQGKKPADLVRAIHRYAAAAANGDCKPHHSPVSHVIALRVPNGESFYHASDAPSRVPAFSRRWSS